jgi:dephospho-CoA kinase
MAPLMIGLTGGIAAGKSEALAALERLGAETISADAVVHDLLGSAELRDLLVGRWGDEVAPEGAVDRAEIGRRVFDQPDELSWLESQLHPRVGQRLDEWRRALPQETKFAVVEVPLLFETGMEKAFDTTIAVISDEETRRARAEARGHELLEERSARQLTQEEKAARADHAIRNDGSLEDLERELSELLAKLGDQVEA